MAGGNPVIELRTPGLNPTSTPVIILNPVLLIAVPARIPKLPAELRVTSNVFTDEQPPVTTTL